ncbi:unnamed protein product [Didymodactylos carnosus]|uniref:XK-related protein n=1 Tax=Didymodactylos carnosus TaxID=1234261 RepID=A0A813SQV2_9BILA|nr:unnamed protein product [Didymodactylos carnosus]CAF0803392.1 unnamed protein product [Didymodactylos carnosus]CAF3498383.1 unnamed protein product [Didymodactylos carnosus]CAF3588618.1 unnamed protein product [Didymodactylos carnosus]
MSSSHYEPFTNQDDIQNMSQLGSETTESDVVNGEEDGRILHQSDAQSRSSSQSRSDVRLRSKTISVGTSTSDDHQSPSHTQTGFSLLQSIKDLTHQELFRANPLGLLGKEVIAATGTTNPPEPVPPTTEEPTSSSTPNKLSSIIENESQELQFQVSVDQLQQQPHRLTLADIAPPPIPVLFERDADLLSMQGGPLLLSPLNPTTTKLDFIPDTMTINVFEVFIYAWGVFAFFFDTVTDIILAHAYYDEGSYWLFILTLACVIVPNLTLSLFSLVWYLDGPKVSLQTSPLVNDDSCETSSAESTDVKQNEQHGQDNSGGDIDTLSRRRPTFSTTLASPHESNHYASFSQTDDVEIKQNTLDETVTYANRARYSQTPPSERQKVNASDEILTQPSSATSNALRWIIRIIILVLQLDLCLKYIRGLYYTYKGYRYRKNKEWQRYYLTKQILIDADIALLRVFDVFMDSGSQVILQLYIMLKDSKSLIYDALFLKQSLSIFSSLGSLAYGLSGYSRCLRHMMLTHSAADWPKDKPAPSPVTWWATIIQWVWYVFLITPRVLALAMFAASSRSWFWIIICAHWMGMLFWILRFKTGFCISDQNKYVPREAIFEKCYNIVCSYIYIFCYMNLTEGNTRQRYIAFYTVYYIENIAFSVIYAVHSQEKNLLFKYSLVTFVCTGFWFAVLFQFVYYQCFHPSDHVRANVRHDFSLMFRNRTLAIFDRNRTNIQKSQSCNDIIEKEIKNQNKNSSFDHSLNKSLRKTTSDENINEATHNRFSKQNRQTLLSKQQTIEQHHRLNRSTSDKQESQSRSKQKGFSLLSSPVTNKTRQPSLNLYQPYKSLLNKISVSLKRQPTVSSDYLNDNTVEYRTKQLSTRRPFFDIPSVTLSLQEPLYLNMDEDNDDDYETINNNNSLSTQKAGNHHRLYQSPHLSSISDSVYANEQIMYKIDEDNNDNNSNGNKNNTSNNEEQIVLNAKSLTTKIKRNNNNNQQNYIINNNTITANECCDYPVKK